MHAQSRPAAGGARTGLYQDITDLIISQLEQGCVPWVQPWAAQKTLLTLPKNPTTGRNYSGINVLILWHSQKVRSYTSHRWLTYRQALSIGAHVRKGESATTVVYAERFIPKQERARAAAAGDEAASVPFLRRFSVFNVDQCDNLPDDIRSIAPLHDEDLMEPRALALIGATRAEIRIGGDCAFYSPHRDFIQLPAPQSFFQPIDWHRTAFHELTHWTGAKHRLDRDQTGVSGSPSYGREELVAEIGSAYVCAALGMAPTLRHSEYLNSWLEILREDNRAILRAASAASKASEYILGFLPNADTADDPTSTASQYAELEVA